jgi:Protein of unknown function (DUF3309)
LLDDSGCAAFEPVHDACFDFCSRREFLGRRARRKTPRALDRQAIVNRPVETRSRLVGQTRSDDPPVNSVASKDEKFSVSTTVSTHRMILRRTLASLVWRERFHVRLILLVLLILLLLGALPTWPYSAHWGYYPSGGLGIILIILIIVIFADRG